MAIVKEKARLRARLVGLYPGTQGFLQERLDALAAKLKATDESTEEEIDQELTALNDSGFQTFEEIKRADDKHRNEINKLKLKPEDTPAPEEQPVSTDPVIAAMQKQMADMAKLLADKDAKEAKNNLAAKFKADPRLKGVPASWLKNTVPASEEEYEEAVENLAKEFKDFATENKLDTLAVNDTPPAGAAPQKGAKPQATDEEVDAALSGLLPGIAAKKSN